MGIKLTSAGRSRTVNLPPGRTVVSAFGKFVFVVFAILDINVLAGTALYENVARTTSAASHDHRGAPFHTDPCYPSSPWSNVILRELAAPPKIHASSNVVLLHASEAQCD